VEQLVLFNPSLSLEKKLPVLTTPAHLQIDCILLKYYKLNGLKSLPSLTCLVSYLSNIAQYVILYKVYALGWFVITIVRELQDFRR
jgi:hypothetical protein